MEENVLNVNFINGLMAKKENFEIGEKVNFTYKNGNANVWNLTLKREEEKYYPYIFSLEGNKVGTNETWSRRYSSLEDAILHIVNCFNENANVKDEYSNIEDYIKKTIIAKDKENTRKADYMMLDRLRTDCEYFLGNGNGFLGSLYYKDIDEHIKEMKKIYESFTAQEKPEWISLKDIDNYKEKMQEKLKEQNFIKYSKKFFELLSEKFEDNISYRYKLLVIKNEETNQYSVNVGIDSNNDGSKNKFAFFTYNDFQALDKEKQLEYMGNIYNTDILGKNEKEFTIEDAETDFLEICNFNYLRDLVEEKENEEV